VEGSVREKKSKKIKENKLLAVYEAP